MIEILLTASGSSASRAGAGTGARTAASPASRPVIAVIAAASVVMALVGIPQEAEYSAQHTENQDDGNGSKTLAFLNGLGVRYVTCSGLIETGNASSGGGQTDGRQNQGLPDSLFFQFFLFLFLGFCPGFAHYVSPPFSDFPVLSGQNRLSSSPMARIFLHIAWFQMLFQESFFISHNPGCPCTAAYSR